MGVCVTERTDYCCLPIENNIQTLLTQTWRAAKGLQGMATEYLLSRATQLFLHSEVSLVFSLLITIATASSINIRTSASCGWLTSLLHLSKSHNTQLQFDPCCKTLVKGNLLCPAHYLRSAVLPSSSRVNVLQLKTFHCLLQT